MKITEYNLLGNYPKSNRQRLQWNVNGRKTDTDGGEKDRNRIKNLEKKVVIIKPTDLVTFVVKIA